MKQHKFPEGITKKVIGQIYDEGGYSDHVENIYENPSIYVDKYRILASINWTDQDPTLDTVWTKENGFHHCPTWVYQELVKRGLAPEIRMNRPESLTKELQLKFDYQDIEILKSIKDYIGGVESDGIGRAAYVCICDLIKRHTKDPRTIDSLTDEDWKKVFEEAKARDLKVFLIKSKEINQDYEFLIEVIIENETDSWYEEHAFIYDSNKNVCTFDTEYEINQHAAFKYLDSLGVDLTKKE